MGILAATMSSCGSEPDKRCVDRNTTSNSRNPSAKGQQGNGSYYYGGKSSPPPQRPVHDGSFDNAAVDRGGFGCSLAPDGG